MSIHRYQLSKRVAGWASHAGAGNAWVCAIANVCRTGDVTGRLTSAARREAK
ncbi:MAG UNVERIFIED_CONTAM: hypothetical protein LVR18_29135 [Planctomycetaceae bacterium]